MGVEASASETCQISGTTSAVCQITLNLDIEVAGVTTVNTHVVTTTSFSGSVVAGVPVTLTGGVEKLAAATAASGSVSGSGSSSKASSSGGAASSSVAEAASAASTSSTSVSIVPSERSFGSRLTPDF
jgi:hypothetical protein